MPRTPNAPLSPKDPVRPSSPSKSSLWTHAYGGTQLAISVLLGFYGGHWLDGRLGWAPWLTLAGAALGVFVGLYAYFSWFFRRGPRGGH